MSILLKYRRKMNFVAYLLLIPSTQRAQCSLRKNWNLYLPHIFSFKNSLQLHQCFIWSQKRYCTFIIRTQIFLHIVLIEGQKSSFPLECSKKLTWCWKLLFYDVDTFHDNNISKTIDGRHIYITSVSFRTILINFSF